MSFKFFDKDQEKEIDIPPERWRWVAHFEDGSELIQFDPTTEKYHQFKEIAESGKKVISFRMISESNPRGINLLVPEGADLIHYYRNQRLENGSINIRYYIFGWKINIDGKSFKRMLKIYPDDSIEIMDDDGRENY